MTEPVNVLLISTDQHRGDCLGVEKRGVNTPHLDALCKRGTRFASCITPHPMCQAARASILTGKLPYSHGVRDNGRNLDEGFSDEGLGGLFASAGYETAFIGKAHFSTHETFAPTGRPECYISTADYSRQWTGPYFGFQSAKLTLRPHHHCAWQDPPHTLHYEDFLNADQRGRDRWETAKEKLPPHTNHIQVWRSALSEEWHSTAWVGDQAVELIDHSSDTPFFAWISFPDPHPPFLAPRPWADKYEPSNVDIPIHRDLDLERRPWWHRAFVENKARKEVDRPHAQGGAFWGEMSGVGEDELRDITAVYYGMISAVDEQVGRIVEALDRAGKLENTVIAFVSDHGEWLGDHGLLLKGPMLYDGLLRVPCIIAGPGVPEGNVVDDPVSLVDLRQTLSELCGVSASPDDGASLVSVMQGKETREFAYNEWEVDPARSGIELDLRTVRTSRYRLSTDVKSGAGELYDLLNDPDELENLFDDPAAKETRTDLLTLVASRPQTMIPRAPRVGWH